MEIIVCFSTPNFYTCNQQAGWTTYKHTHMHVPVLALFSCLCKWLKPGLYSSSSGLETRLALVHARIKQPAWIYRPTLWRCWPLQERKWKNRWRHPWTTPWFRSIQPQSLMWWIHLWPSLNTCTCNCQGSKHFQDLVILTCRHFWCQCMHWLF